MRWKCGKLIGQKESRHKEIDLQNSYPILNKMQAFYKNHVTQRVSKLQWQKRKKKAKQIEQYYETN